MAQQPPNPPAYWRLVLCDFWGNTLSILDQIASDVEFEYRLNRPASCSFSVPSEDRRVNTWYSTTHQPYLRVGNRIVKAYRKANITQPGGWELRFAGRVWSLEDSGDGDTCRTAVTCFDPLMDLQSRLVRRKDGTFAKAATFNNVSMATIIRRMIDRTNTFGATKTLLRTETNDDYWTAGGSTYQSYDQAYILPSMTALTDSGLVDLLPRDFGVNGTGFYNDFSDSTKTTWPFYLVLGTSARRGADRRRSVVGYAGPPRNAVAYNRTISLDTFANDITFYGKSVKGHSAHATDISSYETYGSFEAAEVLSDIEQQSFVDDLAAEAIALRGIPRDLVSFVPTPERAINPFVEFNLGDTITVNAGIARDAPFAKVTDPATRDTATGSQRVYGFKLALSDDYGEQVTELTVSPDAE